MNEVPHNGTDTSEAAAESMSPHVSRLAEEVLDYIKRRGCGATCEEVERSLRMKHQTASARIRELSLAGRVQDTGERRYTSSGRTARVYAVAG